MYTFEFEIQQTVSGKIVVESNKRNSADVFAEIRPALEQMQRLEDFPGIKMLPQDSRLVLVGVSRTEPLVVPLAAS